MKLIITENYEEMSLVAAQYVLGQMHSQYRVNIALTTGHTPEKMYEILIPYIKNKEYFENVHYYNFDEIPYKGENGYGVTMTTLKNLFFTPANISDSHIHILNSENYKKWDEKIKNDGGIDFMIMGLGEDGHYCGNLPNTTRFGDITTMITDDQTRGIHEAMMVEVLDESRCPNHYVTMGPKSVMQTKKIVMIASGKRKSEIVKSLVKGPVLETVPATLLTTHPDFTLIIDREAATLL